MSLFIVLVMFSEEFSWYVGGMEREKAEQFLIDVSNRRGGGGAVHTKYVLVMIFCHVEWETERVPGQGEGEQERLLCFINKISL